MRSAISLEEALASKNPSHFKHKPMKYILISFAVLAITFALAMLWIKGKDQKDRSLKIIAVAAAIAFIMLAFIFTGSSSDE